MLWPLQVTEARYIVGTSAFATPGLRLDSRVARRASARAVGHAGCRTSRPRRGLAHVLHLRDSRSRRQDLRAGPGELHRRSREVACRPGGGPSCFRRERCGRSGSRTARRCCRSRHRSFQGYRLLQEYFAFPDRFLFFSRRGTRRGFSRCRRRRRRAPAALRPKRAGLRERARRGVSSASTARRSSTCFRERSTGSTSRTSETELHVVPDLSRPMDFEVFSVDRVLGFRSGGESIAEILPFYSTGHRTIADDARAYYTIQRRPRLASQKQRRTGARTNYLGSECFLSLVDSQHRDITGEIRQLEVEAHCTNRDLPIGLSFGKSRLEFSVEGGAPVQTVRCLAGPTTPRASPAFGDTAWKLIGQLSLNYLSLVDTDEEKGARDAAPSARALLGCERPCRAPPGRRRSSRELPPGRATDTRRRAHHLRQGSAARPDSRRHVASKGSGHCGSARCWSVSSRATCRSIHSLRRACCRWNAGRSSDGRSGQARARRCSSAGAAAA